MSLGRQKVVVLFAWGLTLVFFPWHWFGGQSFVAAFVPDFETNVRAQITYWWLCTFLASIAAALALGLKNALLALPGFLFLPVAFFVAALSAQCSDGRPIYVSLLFSSSSQPARHC